MGVASLVMGAIVASKIWSEAQSHKYETICTWLCCGLFMVWPWSTNWWISCTIAVLFGVTWGVAFPLLLGMYTYFAGRKEMASSVWVLRTGTVMASAVFAPVIFGLSVPLVTLSVVWTSVGGIAAFFRLKAK